MLEVAEVLRGAQRISAFCHENPDGDTLGAAIAIALAAERLGKQAEVVSVDPPPPFLAFLPGVERVRRSPALEPDVAVIVGFVVELPWQQRLLNNVKLLLRIRGRIVGLGFRPEHVKTPDVY